MQIGYFGISGLFLSGYIAGIYRKRIRTVVQNIIKWANDVKAKEDAKKAALKNKEKTNNESNK